MASRPKALRVRTRAPLTSVERDLRQQVARELHDQVAQTLTGMLIDLENFKSEEVSWVDVLRQLETIQGSTRQVLHNLRQLLYDLRAEEVAGDHFRESVDALVASFAERTGIAAKLTVLPGWPGVVAQAAWYSIIRIIEESLVNVVRHSGARSVHIILQGDGHGLVSVEIADDGRGYDPDFHRPGLGFVGMKERALILGGACRIDSHPGVGTTVWASFPRELVAEAPRPEQVTYLPTPTPDMTPVLAAVPV